MSHRSGRAVIVGSAFGAAPPAGLELTPMTVKTAFGEATLHQVEGMDDAWVLFRHRLPHRLLPNQIPYRAHAAALRSVGVEALLVTSSVGVLDAALPLNRLLPVSDLYMPDNRLPDGSACTMFVEPDDASGHLVLSEGLFDARLGEIVAEIASDEDIALGPAAIFAYAQGPRTKTAFENRALASIGAQVNSMTVGPEVVLANELEIATAAAVVGHKYSVPGKDNPDGEGIASSLEAARHATQRLIVAFLERDFDVHFSNHIYRFEEQ